MKIFIDTREMFLYEKMQEMKEKHFNTSPHSIDVQTMTLHIGDIFISTKDNKHVCIFERKTLTDFISSIKDGRYKEQSHRLLHSTHMHPHNIVYIVEGTMNQIKSPIEKKMLYGAMSSLHFFKGVSVIRTTCVNETAEYILHFTEKVAKNAKEGIFPKYENHGSGNPNDENSFIPTVEDCDISSSPAFATATATYTTMVKKNKKENLTPENIGSILLSQIPQVGAKVADAIMKKYNGNFLEVLLALKGDESSTEMKEITFDNGRKIPANSIEKMRLFLCNPLTPGNS
jgi:ERCC4-type nuclease